MRAAALWSVNEPLQGNISGNLHQLQSSVMPQLWPVQVQVAQRTLAVELAATLLQTYPDPFNPENAITASSRISRRSVGTPHSNIFSLRKPRTKGKHVLSILLICAKACMNLLRGAQDFSLRR